MRERESWEGEEEEEEEGGEMNYVGVGQWRDGLLMALSLQLEESCREGKQLSSGERD